MPFLRTAFLDLLFNALLLFVCLFALAFMQMRPVQDGQSIEAKAELMLEMTWPDGSLDDVDMWVLLPDGQKVGFNRKDPGVATLDRDDRGAYGDTFWDGTERKLIRVNREVVAVRANLPGRYVVNAHYYAHFSEGFAGFKDEWARSHIPVKAKLIKLNPRITEIGAAEDTLFAVGQQATLFDFQVDAAGNVSAFNADADLPFVEVSK
jgi:hypothetical protein